MASGVGDRHPFFEMPVPVLHFWLLLLPRRVGLASVRLIRYAALDDRLHQAKNASAS
jgi:hypothetical protein